MISSNGKLVSPGTARLPIVVPAAILSFFYLTTLEYVLPLYFSALADAARVAGDVAEAGAYTSIYSKLVILQHKLAEICFRLLCFFHHYPF